MEKSYDFLLGWLVGFVDGEGCFCVSFNKKKRLSCKLEVRPSFSISQKSHSLNSLKLLQSFFNCGGIRYSKKDGTYKYEVRKLSDLVRIIVPFFEKNTLKTKKSQDFFIFSLICKHMLKGFHLNRDKLGDIIRLAYKMNGSGKRKYQKEELLKFITS